MRMSFFLAWLLACGFFFCEKNATEPKDDNWDDQVVLYDLVNLGDNKIQACWAPSKSSVFREYKLYRGETSGLDESTGTLIHVATERNDTLFVDRDTTPNTTFYYRVFIVYKDGKLIGSNLQNIKTDVVNLLRNGSFENFNSVTGEFPFWTNYVNSGGQIVAETQSPWEGESSLKWEITADGNGGEFFLIQHGLATKDIFAGHTYELTGWFKYRSSEQGEVSFTYILRGQDMEPDISNGWDNTHPSQSDEWEQFRFEFAIPEDASAASYMLYLSLITWAGDVMFWVDDVKLQLVR